VRGSCDIARSVRNFRRRLLEALTLNSQAALEFERQVAELREQIQREIDRTDLRFLYDATRRLFAIGYNPAMASTDTSYYDLLASEARLASLIAISRGEVPVRHWFSLARPFGTANGHNVLCRGGTVRVPDAGALHPDSVALDRPEAVARQSNTVASPAWGAPSRLSAL
jgi:hypothetical protein